MYVPTQVPLGQSRCTIHLFINIMHTALIINNTYMYTNCIALYIHNQLVVMNTCLHRDVTKHYAAILSHPTKVSHEGGTLRLLYGDCIPDYQNYVGRCRKRCSGLQQCWTKYSIIKQTPTNHCFRLLHVNVVS